MNSKREFELKLRRAQHHLDNLDREITIWLDRNFETLWQEKDPERPDYFSAYVTMERPPINIALLIGDALHNLRGTLDHLAYTLAERYTGSPLPDDIAKHSEFPIFRTLEQERIQRKIRGMHPDAQAIIEQLQPYQAGADWAKDPLWMLHELSNLDKHRLLLTNALVNAMGLFREDRCRNVITGVVELYPGCIEGKTKIATFQARPRDPQQEMNVQFQPIVDVVFQCGCVVDGKSVQQWLNWILFHIKDIIIPKFAPFL